MHDLLIIGGGPGGVSAGVYASRKQLKTVLVAEEWGGQSVVSPEIQNWIGTVAIPGAELAKSLANHLKAYAGEIVTIKEGVRVTSVEKTNDGFNAVLSNGESLVAKTVLVTSGSARRKLDVPGAETLDHKGLTYCASCDGPLFSGQDVVVVGGGNAGFETAAQLLAYTKSVTLLNRSEVFRADPVTVEKVKAHPNMTIISNAIPSAVLGEKFVSGIKYKDATTGEEKELHVGGIFVEIGLIPNTDFIAQRHNAVEDRGSTRRKCSKIAMASMLPTNNRPTLSATAVSTCVARQPIPTRTAVEITITTGKKAFMGRRRK